MPRSMIFPLLSLSLLLAAGPAHADTVVVTADRMLDVVTGHMVPNPQITITDGRITTVGSKGTATPENARHVDLPGITLLPGLIDMHVHLNSDARISGDQYLEYTDTFWAVIGVANAKAMLEAGFTTVRNVGSRDYDDVALKQGVEHGYFPGPRIVPATYALGTTGGHCDSTEGLPPKFGVVPAASVADGPEAFRLLVRKVHKYGAEVIKICATGGVLSRTDVAGAQQMSYEEMKAVTDEAHMLGLKVAAPRVSARVRRP